MDKEIIKLMREAIKKGKRELVKELLDDNEGLIDTITPFGSWLQVASAQGEIDIVNDLLKRGIDINVSGGIFEGGAIRNAAFEGHTDIVKVLVLNGARLDVSEANRNPLFAAIYSGHYEVAKYLIDSGIDITAEYSIGKLDNVDAYEYARQFGRTDIANYLKEKRGNGEKI